MIRWRRATTLVVLLFIGIDPVAAQDLSQPGPYPFGMRVVTITRPDQTTFVATVYYPASLEGRNPPVSFLGKPYPPIVFDSIVSPTSYESTLSHLASWGFVAIMPNFAIRWFPDTLSMSADMGLCVDFLIAESTRPDSPFADAIRSDRCGFGGHSLGAGCAIQQGVNESDRVKVVVALSGDNRTIPPSSEVVDDLRVPLLMLTGSQDLITPIPTRARPVYDAAPQPKGFFTLDGGNHMQFTDVRLASIAANTMPHDEQRAISRHFLTAAFRLYVSDDDSVWPLLWDPIAGEVDNVLPERASGIEWTADAPTAALVGGQTVEFAATVTNTAPNPQGFDLFVDSESWPAEIVPVTLASMATGESAPVVVRVTVPSSGAETETLRLSARSRRDGHTRGVLRVNLHRATTGARILQR
jgi:predicted dienelactone hydrolase